MSLIKKIIIFLFIAVSTQTVCFADSIDTDNGLVNGRIEALSDGLLFIKKNGISTSYTRVSPAYEDFIVYRESAFTLKKVQFSCRVIYVDDYRVRYETPETFVDVPRYRVSEMIIRVKNVKEINR